MMADILLAYHSVYGCTRGICEAIQSALRGRGHRVDVVSLEGGCASPARYDVIVIGASVRNGMHNPVVSEFILANQTQLLTKLSAFFSVNLVARKPGKNTPETNPYVRKFLARTSWKPQLTGVFAGNLDYVRYSGAERNIIRLIMWLTGGPTDPRARVEFTDWNEVRQYAEKIDALTAGRVGCGNGSIVRISTIAGDTQ